jgi:hypothetical protein
MDQTEYITLEKNTVLLSNAAESVSEKAKEL